MNEWTAEDTGTWERRRDALRMKAEEGGGDEERLCNQSIFFTVCALTRTTNSKINFLSEAHSKEVTFSLTALLMTLFQCVLFNPYTLAALKYPPSPPSAPDNEKTARWYQPRKIKGQIDGLPNECLCGGKGQ